MSVNTDNTVLLSANPVSSGPGDAPSSASSGGGGIHLPDGTNAALQAVGQKMEAGWNSFMKWGRDVVHGDREEIQKEIIQIASNSKGNERKVLIIESDAVAADHPDAYKQFPVKADIAKFREMAKNNEIDYCPINTRGNYVMNLRKRTKEFYDEVRVRGHGDYDRVLLGKFELSKGEDTKANLQQLAARVKEGGTVIFEACNVGAGEDNLAKTFSGLCPQATVYASDKTHDPIFGLSETNGAPSFKGGLLGVYGDSTRIYKKGELVSNKRW